MLMPDTGSAYGGKHTGKSAIEAARLARSEALSQIGMEPRGGIYLGVLSSRGSYGGDRRGPKGWRVNRVGIP